MTTNKIKLKTISVFKSVRNKTSKAMQLKIALKRIFFTENNRQTFENLFAWTTTTLHVQG